MYELRVDGVPIIYNDDLEEIMDLTIDYPENWEIWKGDLMIAKGATVT